MIYYPCNFLVIEGSTGIKIGNGGEIWEKNLDIQGLMPEEDAILMFEVKGLTYSTRAGKIIINDQVIGQITPSIWTTNGNENNLSDAAREHWQTQIVTIEKNILNNSRNILQIVGVIDEGASGVSEIFDDFFIRNLICFFKVNPHAMVQR